MNRDDKQEVAHVIEMRGFDILWRSYGDLTDMASREPKFKALVLDHLRACLALARYLGAEREVRDISGAIEAWRET
jgi:hypothetical protein